MVKILMQSKKLTVVLIFSISFFLTSAGVFLFDSLKTVHAQSIPPGCVPTPLSIACGFDGKYGVAGTMGNNSFAVICQNGYITKFCECDGLNQDCGYGSNAAGYMPGVYDCKQGGSTTGKGPW